MEIKVIDNFIKDETLFEILQNHFAHEMPHYYVGHSKNKSEGLFYKSDLDPMDVLSQYILSLAHKIVKKNFKVIRMYLNIHHKEMPGSWHLDDGDGTNVTCLLMVQGSGSFEIRRETIVDFVPNRFIVFDASIEHRGNAPDKATPSITFAIKIKLDDN